MLVCELIGFFFGSKFNIIINNMNIILFYFNSKHLLKGQQQPKSIAQTATKANNQTMPARQKKKKRKRKEKARAENKLNYKYN